MRSTHLLYRRIGLLLVSGLWIASASCAMVEKQIDRTAGGPGLPPDTAVLMRAQPTGEPLVTPAPKLSQDPMKITIAEAILLSLENNRTLEVERLNPSIEKTFEDQERAEFDPQTNAEISAGRIKGERLGGPGDETESFTTDAVDGFISLEQFFPTGTTVAVEGSTQGTDSSLYQDDFYVTRFGMTFTQALLRGYGTEVNLARLRQARLDTRLSEFELRGFTEFLVAQVERTYWDYALARRQIEIVEESLKLARQQLNETKELIAVGRLAEAELAAVQAEVAAQEQGLINARSNMEAIHLQLLRLLNPPGPGLWERKVDLVYRPTLPDIKLDDVELHVAVSMRMRPVLNEARLGVLRDDLELVRTKNGLLPLMDLFITLGKSGYATSFGDSVSNIDEDSYDALTGVRFQYPIFNRDAKARHQRAQLSRDQAQKALENLSQLVEVDVRTAYIEVNRAKQQISASSATRKFDEEKLRIETEKFRVGKSTNLLVAQAQRDLLISRIAEVQALANYLKALIDLYQQDGSLLERRGISAPGREPVNLPKN
ncbi:MAG: TolC family protein [Desulfobacterales bacterium]|nr:MAG: TolC family protein [Desulfobacterales bacterium]